MPIVTTINNQYQFLEAMRAANRGEQFTREGMYLLFDFYDSLGDNVEFDAVGICCDFIEDSEANIRAMYDIPVDEKIEDYLSYHTTYLGATEELDDGTSAHLFMQF